MPPMPADALIMGDFNIEWSAPEYDRIVGPLTAQFGRLNRVTGFVDAWVAAGHREDAGATICSGRRIDFCFVSSSLRQEPDTTTGLLQHSNLRCPVQPLPFVDALAQDRA